ncbi:MAG: pyridoxamine 5'-phosphate oxidase [Bacteroidota bacterium]
MDVIIQDLRENYLQDTLELDNTAENPFDQFKAWLDFAIERKIKEPNAMILATTNKDGRPAARVVLLKGIREDGFLFYTNYNSQKGNEMLENPYAALVFNWLDLEKQIRIEGKVEKLAHKDSEAYFQTRPKASQIGAWASPQSSVIEDRKLLEDNVTDLKQQYKDTEQLPCPTHWGGYIVKPDLFEFWQGRSSRLHDRIQYNLENEEWTRVRLAP